MLPEAARLPDPVLLAVEERLLCRVYDCDLLDGMATGISAFFVFASVADFHSSCCCGGFFAIPVLSRTSDGSLKMRKKKR